MSILSTSNAGWLISHSLYIKNIYKDLDNKGAELKQNLFKLNTPYRIQGKKRSNKLLKVGTDSIEYQDLNTDVQHVKNSYNTLSIQLESYFNENVCDCELPNKEALETAEQIYKETDSVLVEDAFGSNLGPAVIKEINKAKFLFPKDSRFFCKNVMYLSNYLVDEKFDLILLDPPWWNKYIRRKRSKSNDAYDMLYNQDLRDLQIKNLLAANGLVVVWCTNSAQHLKALKEEIFPKWGVTYIGKWFWVKVTNHGIPVCDFSNPPGKQPFEQIIFGSESSRTIPSPPTDKLVVSVPSALHSHKPPLCDLLKPYLPVKPTCLEVFARYLLPGWTSFGNEPLRFQHDCVYA